MSSKDSNVKLWECFRCPIVMIVWRVVNRSYSELLIIDREENVYLMIWLSNSGFRGTAGLW